jgi:opacity protein-like surface antigen
VTLLGGFTVSFSRDFGWSLIAGVTINITENVALKYTASFLSNVVEYQVQPQPTTNYGVKNLLSLDWKF